MRAGVWFASVSLVGVSGCASLWGFQDLSDAVDAAADQTTGADSSAPMDATVDRSANADDSSTEDAPDSSSVDAGGGDEGDADDAAPFEASSDSGGDAGAPGDGGDAGDAGEAGGKGDGGDGGDASLTDCAHTCDAGCCDSQGKCLAGTSPTACGTNRAACQNCSTVLTTTCGTLSGPCCQKQACVCAAASLCL